MSTQTQPGVQPDLGEQAAGQGDQTEYDRFKAGLKQILSVSKEELDRREADWRERQKEKKDGDKKAG